MRGFLLLLSMLLFAFPLFSQIKDEKSDSLKQEKSLSIEISPVIAWNSVFDRYSAYGALEVAMVLDEKYVFGIHGELLLGEFLKRVVFPNIYEFDHYKVGVNSGYQIDLIEGKLRLRPQLQVNLAYAIWKELENQRFYTDDSYFEFRPEITIGYYPIKRLSVFSGIGYNMVSGLDLVGTTEKDLKGENLSLGIRFTLFSK